MDARSVRNRHQDRAGHGFGICLQGSTVTLNLDLASAKAKVARASELLDVLERDLPIHLSQNGPYAVRFRLTNTPVGVRFGLSPQIAATTDSACSLGITFTISGGHSTTL